MPVFRVNIPGGNEDKGENLPPPLRRRWGSNDSFFLWR